MGKFDNKEGSRTNGQSAAKRMGSGKNKVEKKLVSFQASAEMYKKFTYINSVLGINNTTAINLFIADYVQKNSDKLSDIL